MCAIFEAIYICFRVYGDQKFEGFSNDNLISHRPLLDQNLVKLEKKNRTTIYGL